MYDVADFDMTFGVPLSCMGKLDEKQTLTILNDHYLCHVSHVRNNYWENINCLV